MKKNIFLTLALLMVSAMSFAQVELGNPSFYTIPAIYTPTDEVSFYFDMTDVGFQEGVDLYWWVWQPTEPDAGNWENSSDFAKLEYLGDNMYKKTFVPLDYFFQNQTRFATKAELLAFMEDPENGWGEAGYWSRLKTKDGAYESGVFCVEKNIPEITDFANSGEAIKVYSGAKSTGYKDKWTLDKPLSILFNGDLVKIEGRTLNEIAADGDFKYFGVHAGVHGYYTDQEDNVIEYDFVDPPLKNINQGWNIWRPGCIQKAQLHNCGNGIWKWDVQTPQQYFAYNPCNADEGPAGVDTNGQPFILTDGGMVDANGNPAPNPDFFGSFQAEELAFGLVGNDWDKGANFNFDRLKAGTAEAYPDPAFSFFPSKISAYDIVTFIRQYNGRTDGELTWTITAGDKTFTGTMGGNRDKRQGSADLLSNLAGSNAESIHVVITNVKGATVVETDIPLTAVDE